MRILDAFLFSEEHEKEVLLLKFILSDKHVDEWLICENAYSHQGDYKGLVARRLIANDKRFEPYRKKITIIEREQQFEVIDKTKVQDDIAFKAENWQRNLALPYFLEHYGGDDWIAINDADEMFDFTDENRVAEFFKRLEGANEQGYLKVPRQRYWFDFDNQHINTHTSLLCTKKFLVQNKHLTLSTLRKLYTFGAEGWENAIIFEYSSCFSREYIMRKLDTNPHTGISRQSLEQALRCNHRAIPLYMLKKKLKPTKHFFFEEVELTEKNSPLYVRQHLRELKTNVVDKNYRDNRKKDYPYFYTFYYSFFENIKEFASLNSRRINKKFRRIFKLKS